MSYRSIVFMLPFLIAAALMVAGTRRCGQAGPATMSVPLHNRIDAQTPASDGILICNEPVFDFGRVLAGSSIQVDFPVTNTSGVALWIEVLRSCSCSGPPFRCRIEPGQTILLPVTLKAPHYTGPVSKTVTVRIVAVLAPLPPATYAARIADSCNRILGRCARARGVLRPTAMCPADEERMQNDCW